MHKLRLSASRASFCVAPSATAPSANNQRSRPTLKARRIPILPNERRGEELGRCKHRRALERTRAAATRPRCADVSADSSISESGAERRPRGAANGTRALVAWKRLRGDGLAACRLLGKY
eukprot:359853-Chlamydomonas_euryale.AAC.16